MGASLHARTSPVTNPALGHCWHSRDDGKPIATVDLAGMGSAYLAFDDPADARALAAACTAAAEALEQMAAGRAGEGNAQ